MPGIEEEIANMGEEDFNSLVSAGSFTESEIQELTGLRAQQPKPSIMEQTGDILKGVAENGGISVGMGVAGSLSGGILGGIAAGGVGTLIEKVLQSENPEASPDVMGLESLDTGSILGNTAAEVGIDALLSTAPQAKATAKALRSKGLRSAVSTAFTEKATQGVGFFTKPIFEDVAEVRKVAKETGTDIPVVPASKVLSGEMGSFLSSLTFTNKGEVAQRQIDKALENVYGKMHGLRKLSDEDAGSILMAFRKSMEKATELKRIAADPLNATKAELEGVDLFGQIGERLTRQKGDLGIIRNQFRASKPIVSFSTDTVSSLNKATAQLDDFAASINPGAKGLAVKLKKLRNLITEKKTVGARTPGIDIFSPSGNKLKLGSKGRTEVLGKTVEKPTLFDLVDDLDDIVIEAGGAVTPAKAQQLQEILEGVKKSIGTDIVQSLGNDPNKVQLYDKYLRQKDILNSVPSKLSSAVASADHVAFMEAATNNHQVSTFLTNRLGKEKTRRFAAQYLLDKHTTERGVDFRAIVKDINDPSQRAAIRTLLGGSDALDRMKQFASVAENVSLPSSKRNLLAYNVAGGTMTLGIPAAGAVKKAAGSLVFAFGLDNILFNPKIGKALTDRTLGDALKTDKTKKAAQATFRKIYGALQGTQVALNTLDENGDVLSSRDVIVNGIGADGQPRFENIDSGNISVGSSGASREF